MNLDYLTHANKTMLYCLLYAEIVWYDISISIYFALNINMNILTEV